MSTVAGPTFSGFSHEALQFLVDLAGNNERAWFQPRKAQYERLLKAPLEGLCVALGERFEVRGIPLQSDPAHSPFRIYRDVRFSKDKSPYKTHLSASFPWSGSPSGGADAPRSHTGDGGGYFHLSPSETYIGGGFWHPDSGVLAAFRRAVVDDTDRVMAVLESPAFVRRFGSISGETTLKRVPTGYPADHPHADLLKLKDILFGVELSADDAFSPALPDTIADAFADAMPIFELMATLERHDG
jgi:uncharacterized protein (TIGR02453 family)